jgi:hypothetical protein
MENGKNWENQDGPGMDLHELSKDGHVLFVGALSCARHKQFGNVGQLMRSGSVSLLCPDMSDMATGRYLSQAEAAVLEIAKERNIKKFYLMYGCQSVILSSDYELLAEQLKTEHGITLITVDASHLCDKD